MSDLAGRIRQCRKPSGPTGKAIADEMNESHFNLTSWGLSQVAIAKNDTLLDVGCGGGRTVHRLAMTVPEGKVMGIDYSPDCVSWSRAYNQQWIKDGRAEILQAGADNMPFENERFEMVFAIETVYFWHDLPACFAEVKRVLKPAGKFVILNEVYESETFKERNDAFLAAGDMRIFAPRELQALLLKSGFARVSSKEAEEKNWLCCIAEK